MHKLCQIAAKFMPRLFQIPVSDRCFVPEIRCTGYSLPDLFFKISLRLHVIFPWLDATKLGHKRGRLFYIRLRNIQVYMFSERCWNEPLFPFASQHSSKDTVYVFLEFYLFHSFNFLRKRCTPWNRGLYSLSGFSSTFLFARGKSGRIRAPEDVPRTNWN